MTVAGPTVSVRVAGGIVAYNDADRLPCSVQSLLSQVLPPSTAWSGIWLVVSPSPDATVEVARKLAISDARIHVVEEPCRRGKATALSEVLRWAEGDVVVLLNGDAEAAPGAVAELLSARPPDSEPYAIMGHPIPATRPQTMLDEAIDLMWSVHDRFHAVVLAQHQGSHLSDELLLLPLAHRPPIPADVITDGAYVAGWLLGQGGLLLYAPRALVRVTVPARLREHFLQRRRIHRGHRQVGQLLGNRPTTLPRWAVVHPREAVRVVVDSARGHRHPWGSLLALMCIEGLGYGFALWDAALRRRESVSWERIRGRTWDTPTPPTHDEPFD